MGQLTIEVTSITIKLSEKKAIERDSNGGKRGGSRLFTVYLLIGLVICSSEGGVWGGMRREKGFGKEWAKEKGGWLQHMICKKSIRWLLTRVEE